MKSSIAADTTRDRDHKQTSESSSIIKQNINKTMYSALPDMKEKDSKAAKGKLGEMQAKA